MAKEKSFGDLLVEGLQEAVAWERGELKGVEVRRVDLTARKAKVEPPPRYDAAGIAGIRHRLNVSQPVFASMLNVSSGTVKAWEQGTRTPAGPTLRLLEVAEQYPEAIAVRLVPGRPIRQPSSSEDSGRSRRAGNARRKRTAGRGGL